MEQLKINRYRLKKGITEKDLMKHGLKSGGSFIMKGVGAFLVRSLLKDITLNVGFPRDLNKWNDFDYILVIDEDFGQPYVPFYSYMDGDTKNNVSPFLRRVIRHYNNTMDSFDFLERVDRKDETHG